MPKALEIVIPHVCVFRRSKNFMGEVFFNSLGVWRDHGGVVSAAMGVLIVLYRGTRTLRTPTWHFQNPLRYSA